MFIPNLKKKKKKLGETEAKRYTVPRKRWPDQAHGRNVLVPLADLCL